MDIHKLFAAAIAQHRQGRLAEAEAGYRRVLAVQPDHIDSLHLLGVVMTQGGRHLEAIQLIGRAIALRKTPAAEFHSNLGLAHRAAGEHAEAIRHFTRAVTLKPDYVDAHVNLGATLLDEGRLDDAENHCRRAIRLKPGSAAAHFALAAVAHRQGRLAEAEASYREALRLRAAYPEAWCNLGAVLHDRRALGDAAGALAEALRLRPAYAAAHYNLGGVLQDQGRGDEALVRYQRAQALRPDDADAHWNEALLRLTKGDYLAGWPKYEWRRRLKGYGSRSFAEPLWDGGDLTGRAILLHAEQGFGDTIQFVRYARLVKGRGASAVIVECQPGLARLLESAPGVDRIAPRGADRGIAFDCHAPLPSLPGILGTTLETVPADIPYLAADPARIAAWLERLADRPGLNVGLAWRGNPGNTRDALRSIPAESIARLCDVPGINWVILQIDARPDELEKLSRHDAIRDLGPELTDWAETAALVSALDLVVTVDTAVAHLAGALGRPTWVLLAFVAHWCWLTGRPDSPWYPTARLFRQPALDDWDGALARVRDELARLAADKSVMITNEWSG